MKTEKQYLKELAEELKRFLSLEFEEKEKAAFDLNDNWQFKYRGCPEVSRETEDIVAGLLILHHYTEDPEEHDEMIKQILRDIGERLAAIDKEEKEKDDEKEGKAKTDEEPPIVIVEGDEDKDDD